VAAVLARSGVIGAWMVCRVAHS